MTRNEIISSVKDGVATTNGSAWSIGDNLSNFCDLVARLDDIEVKTREETDGDEWSALSAKLDLDEAKVSRIFVGYVWAYEALIFADENDWKSHVDLTLSGTRDLTLRAK